MKKYFIKIDLDSITKNKNAGQTTSVGNTKKEAFFAHSSMPKGFVDGENCIITTFEVRNDKSIHNVEGIVVSEKLIQKCITGEIELDSFEINVNTENFSHSPIPKYSYSYLPKTVACCNCKKEFSYEKLLSKEDDTRDNYSNTVCPNCGEFRCCTLEYENINDALTRKNKT